MQIAIHLLYIPWFLNSADVSLEWPQLAVAGFNRSTNWILKFLPVAIWRCLTSELKLYLSVSSVFHSSATLLYPSSHLFLLRLVGSREDGLSPLRLNNILNGLVHFWLSFHESRPSNSRESHSLHSLKILGNHLDVWEHFEIFLICSVLRAWNFTVPIFQDELPPIVSNINLQS